MNEQLLTLLGIDIELPIEERLIALEEKQYEYIEREQSANDSVRKEELAEIIQKIEKEIIALKENIKELNSAIIFDNGDEDIVMSTQNNQATNDTTDDELEQKIKELKQKEPLNKLVADEQPATNTSKTKQDSSQNQNTPFSNEESVDENDTEFKKGVKLFNSGNVQKAMEIWENLAKNGDALAQYTVGGMYLFAKDVPKDVDRGLFWLKKSADQDYTDAQNQYGAFCANNAGTDNKMYNEGLKYLAMAADKDNLLSMKDYVNAVLNHTSSRPQIKQAIVYCNRLSQITTDPYEAKQCEDFIKLLKKGNQSKGSNYNYNNNSNSSKTRKTKSSGCSGSCLGFLVKCFIVLMIIALILGVLLDYVEKSKKSKQKPSDNSVTEQSEPETKLGEEIIEAHNLTPIDSSLLTLNADYGHIVDNSSWDGSFVYRAGNGDTTAYAIYEIQGLFETISLEATSAFGTGSFFENSSADIMLINADTNDILDTVTIKYDSGVINMQANISGVNKLGIYVKQTSSGLGNLAYVFVRNVYLYPVGQGSDNSNETVFRIDGNIRENPGTEYSVLLVANGTEFIATGNKKETSNGAVWYEIYIDENKTQTGWAHSSIIE